MPLSGPIVNSMGRREVTLISVAPAPTRTGGTARVRALLGLELANERQ
jgi:hypothetical protein